VPSSDQLPRFRPKGLILQRWRAKNPLWRLLQRPDLSDMSGIPHV
jgi:hypothetical protein